MKTEDLDELVKQYLLAKGYSNTIQELQKESAKINNNYDCADSAGKNSAIVDVDVDADGDSVVMDIDKSNKTVAELKAANSDNSGNSSTDNAATVLHKNSILIVNSK